VEDSSVLKYYCLLLFIIVYYCLLLFIIVSLCMMLGWIGTDPDSPPAVHAGQDCHLTTNRGEGGAGGGASSQYWTEHEVHTHEPCVQKSHVL